MKTIFSSVVVIILIIFSSLTVNGQTSPFTGEWKLNRENTQLQGSQLFMSKIKTDLRSDSLLTTRVYENANGEEYPFAENISLDGKDCKITIYDMPRISKATFSSTDKILNVESVTTFYGNNGEENIKTIETWKIENEGNTLTIGFTTSSSAGTVTGNLFYDKVK